MQNSTVNQNHAESTPPFLCPAGASASGSSGAAALVAVAVAVAVVVVLAEVAVVVVIGRSRRPCRRRLNGSS